MELNQLILLAAAPIYANLIESMQSDNARINAIVEAKQLWLEVLRQEGLAE